MAIPHLPTEQETPSSKGGGDGTEWLDIIISEILDTYRSELRDNHTGPEGDEATRAKVEMQLNDRRPSGFVDPIVVHSVCLGSLAPHISKARILGTTASPHRQQIEFDMTYTDTACISFSTSVLFNFPFPYFARLPASLTLSLSLFSSTILLTLPDPTSQTKTLTFALDPSFTLKLNTSSLLGSRAKLADVPKLHDMIEAQIKKTLASHRSWTIVLPGIARPQGGPDVRYANDEIDVKIVSSGRPPDKTHLGT